MLKGTIVKESLENPAIANGLNVISTTYTKPDYPKSGWCLYKVSLDIDDLEILSKNLKPKQWYAHFWNENSIYVVFPNKVIQLDRKDKNTWHVAINYGISVGIPKEQLDFLIDE